MEKVREYIEGYISIVSKEPKKTIHEEAYVFITPYDALGLYKADKGEIPRIYKVSGTVISKGTCESGDRPYCICKSLTVLKEMTLEDLIRKCSTIHEAYRLVSFYPLTAKEALQIAIKYKENYYILQALEDAMYEGRIEQSEAIHLLFLEAEKSHEETERKQQAYDAAVAKQEEQDRKLAFQKKLRAYES